MSRKERVHQLGVGTRLADAPSAALVESFGQELRYAAALHEGLSYADLAHVVMLVEVGIIPAEEGRELLAALAEMHEAGLTALKLDPRWGDLYNNRDAELERRLGNVAGWMHAGRARREALTLGWLIQLREGCRQVVHAIAGCIDEMARLAAGHIDTLMPDFTYLQHAHPTSLGHYLLGFAFPLLRDAHRLLREIEVVDSSPAGASSTNGSRLPLDRARVQELLGFAGLTLHARDAMWQPDAAIHLMATLVSIGTTLDRLAEELQIWSTSEFDYVSLADRHCRTSVIMPQKKNPYALATLRGRAREMSGQLMSIVATNQTPSGQLDNRNTSYELLPAALAASAQSLNLMREVLGGATFHAERLREEAGAGWTGATELADLLMERERIDARSAHEIVGTVVARSPEGTPADAAPLLAEAFQERMGRGITDPQGCLAAIVPEQIVAGRKGPGSCAPQEVQSMAQELSAAATRMRAEIEQQVSRSRFPVTLREAVSRILGRKW